MKARARCYFTGIVQGVGFRPTLSRLAREENLSGWVLNSTTGVTCEVEGSASACRRFFKRMHEEAPPLAKITSSFMELLPPIGLEGFEIRESEEEEGEITLISPDTAICPDCTSELFDPKDRRYRYPFINCTNCGPRYSIIEALPYDRPNTTMSEFEMCEDCRREYEDPNNRRYHAQPNACPRCGPQVFLTNSQGEVIAEKDEAIISAVQLLASGAIVAIKGIGGFHLAVDAFNNAAVEELRERKKRARFKPFAIMAKDFTVLKEIAHLSAPELALLASPMSPIVLVNKKSSRLTEAISPMIAPRTSLFGVMIPYSPLHLLLFNTSTSEDYEETLQVLVMTSANLSEEPLVFENTEALSRLSGIADYFLMHNRRIIAPADDSIVRFIGGIPRMLRIGRGYAPYPVALTTRPQEKGLEKCVLGFGADLKATFALSTGRFALVSPHLGDMENASAQAFHQRTLKHFLQVFRQKPEIVVADLHPNYHSSKLAEKYAREHSIKLIRTQHHFAHLASCAMENHLQGKLISLSFDGTGYGLDGTIWGAEVLIGERTSFQRIGTIHPLPLPGGEASIHETYRLGLSAIYSASKERMGECIKALGSEAWVERAKIISEMLEKGISLVPSTSLGRLFDAFSAILGICNFATYEAEAAIELEMVASKCRKAQALPYAVYEKNSLLVLDWRPAVIYCLNSLAQSRLRPFVLREGFRLDSPYLVLPRPVAKLAYGFIGMLIEGFSEISGKLSDKHEVKRVVLSGGCFQNKILLEGLSRRLEQLGFEVFAQNGIPANDAGISLGQLALGAQALRQELQPTID